MIILAYQAIIVTHTDSIEINDDVGVSFEYDKPKWLEHHIKKIPIETYVRDSYQKIRDQATELKMEFPNSRLLPFELTIGVERTTNDAYESILIEKREYTGGAHGNTTYKWYNFKNSKDISLKKYLAEITVTEEQLLTLMNTALGRDGYNTPRHWMDLPWQMIRAQKNKTAMGIEFVFSPGTIAPYSKGTIIYRF